MEERGKERASLKKWQNALPQCFTSVRQLMIRDLSWLLESSTNWKYCSFSWINCKLTINARHSLHLDMINIWIFRWELYPCSTEVELNNVLWSSFEEFIYEDIYNLQSSSSFVTARKTGNTDFHFCSTKISSGEDIAMRLNFWSSLPWRGAAQPKE